jgi:hypothetical protein
MTTMTIQSRVTNAADRDDRNAMLGAIQKWNEPIIAENTRRAALTPPGDALPLLPSATTVEQKASYEIVLSQVLQDIHSHNIAQSDVATLQEIRDRWPNANDSQRAAALAALPPSP